MTIPKLVDGSFMLNNAAESQKPKKEV